MCLVFFKWIAFWDSNIVNWDSNFITCATWILQYELSPNCCQTLSYLKNTLAEKEVEYQTCLKQHCHIDRFVYFAQRGTNNVKLSLCTHSYSQQVLKINKYLNNCLCFQIVTQLLPEVCWWLFYNIKAFVV